MQAFKPKAICLICFCVPHVCIISISFSHKTLQGSKSLPFFLQVMAPATRDYIRINISTVPSELKDLVSEFPRNVQFTERHGHLLHLVTSKFEEDMIRVLFQFFDPEHHCFTFPDYQLVPTLEEFSELIGLPVRDQLPFTGLERIPKPEIIDAALHLRKSEIEPNWETKSGVKGLLAKFLMEKARLLLENKSYPAFEEVVALLIYGLVLFPNPDQFISVHIINLFLTRNPVPTLLGDILHSLHTRTMKKRGTLMCCIPLLARWFTFHRPRSVLRNEQRMQWSRRIMSLSHSNIRWNNFFQRDITIIDHCGEYPNVPLLGIKGGITYNPSLALRQFGYARSNGPHDMIIHGIVFDYENDSHRHRRRFIHAWDNVYRIESKTLGQWNSIPMEPYLRWVRTHAQKLLMPYPAVLPVTIEPEIEGYEPQVVLHPNMPTDLEELQKSWVQLKEERDTFKSYCQDYERRILELTGQLQEEQQINTFLGAKRKRPRET